MPLLAPPAVAGLTALSTGLHWKTLLAQLAVVVVMFPICWWHGRQRKRMQAEIDLLRGKL